MRDTASSIPNTWRRRSMATIMRASWLSCERACVGEHGRAWACMGVHGRGRAASAPERRGGPRGQRLRRKSMWIVLAACRQHVLLRLFRTTKSFMGMHGRAWSRQGQDHEIEHTKEAWRGTQATCDLLRLFAPQSRSGPCVRRGPSRPSGAGRRAAGRREGGGRGGKGGGVWEWGIWGSMHRQAPTCQARSPALFPARRRHEHRCIFFLGGGGQHKRRAASHGGGVDGRPGQSRVTMIPPPCSPLA